MSPIFRNIARFCCMFLVFQVFILSAHADDMEDDEFDIEQGITFIHQQHQGTELGEALYQQRTHQQTHMLPEHHHNKKFQSNKHISVQLFFVKTYDDRAHTFYERIMHTPSVPEDYRYIFFREINPPPPKAC